jgi:PEP-CTERM motif-containing protein
MNRIVIVLAGLLILVGPGLVSAASIPWLTDGIDLSAFDQKVDAGDGTPGEDYGVENVAAPTAFGSGDAARIWDMSSLDKPELQGETTSPLTDAFRVDFQSLNQSPLATSKAIRFRMGNAGKSITSESRVAFSVSWQSDGEVTAKYDDGANGVATVSSDELIGVANVSLIINPSDTNSFVYSLFGENRTLNTSAYDVYIDGALLNSDAEFIGGLPFHLGKSAAEYDPALGLQRFGLVGSSNGDRAPDFQYDNIILRTGADVTIPEPQTALLLIMAFGLAGVCRSRRD